jgi:spore coat protein U-like protein
MSLKPRLFPTKDAIMVLHAAHLRRAFCATLIALAASAGALQAQASGTSSANATVSAKVFAPLSIVKNDDLLFGSLYSPYASKSVEYTDNTTFVKRAKFTLAGEGGAEITLVINVPSTLASGTNTLPVGSFELRHHSSDVDGSGTDVALAVGSNTVTLNLTGSAGGAGNRYVRVRATANPGATQATGVYTATMTVTVNYTGA